MFNVIFFKAVTLLKVLDTSLISTENIIYFYCLFVIEKSVKKVSEPMNGSDLNSCFHFIPSSIHLSILAG